MGAVVLSAILVIAVACGSNAGSSVTELRTTDIKVGTGAEARKGATVRVHYTGWLYEDNAAEKKGASFDSSKGGEPYEFQLGSGHVIAGWDQGIAGMRVGGTRLLTIPPDLGYGQDGAPPDIPPNRALVFEVELLDVR